MALNLPCVLLSLSSQAPKTDSLEDANARTKQLLVVKHTLELVKPLGELLGNAQSPLLSMYGRSLVDTRYDEILDEIIRIIEPTARVEADTGKMRTQQIFAIRPGFDGESQREVGLVGCGGVGWSNSSPVLH